MRKTLSLVLFLILSAPCAARETCGLTLNESPVFFDLKLNMTPTEVKSVFGKNLKLGVRKQGTFFQNFITKPPPPFLPDVRALYLRFFDYKLYQIEIFYQTENKETMGGNRLPARFIQILSTEKNLPVRLWTNANGRFQLNCAEFSLVADNVLNPRIELTDDRTKARFDADQERRKEKKN